MIRNYLKIAFRNLWKHKIFSVINITGLAVGLTACFFILSFVHFELSYDNFHTKADRIYRLADDTKTPTETLRNAITAYPIAPAMKNDFPEVTAFVRTSVCELILAKGEKEFKEEHCLAVDSAFFSVFDFKLLKGDPHTALTAPGNIVLTLKTAEKYFGKQDPVGQTLLLPFGDTTLLATVTGVMEELPENSQLKADVLLSMISFAQSDDGSMDNWTNHQPYTYLLLAPGADPGALEAKLPAFLQKHIGKMMDKYQMYYTLTLHPLKEVYLSFGDRAYAGITGSIGNVRIFTFIAVMILLIACFNFINLSTARAAERAREVGIRKVVGAKQKQLVLQYIGESVLLCLLAFILTVVLVSLLLPLFNQLAGKTVSHNLLQNGSALLLLLLGAVGTGVLAGTYPAWVLSSFRPVKVLKGRFVSGKNGISMRRGLVVAQFAISLSLIIATIVVYKQMNYMRNRDLGFQQNQMLVVRTFVPQVNAALKNTVQGLPGVQSVTFSSSAPGMDHTSAYSELENVHGDMQKSNVDLYFVDFNFIAQYKIKMAAGRPFSLDHKTDSTQAMVLNEAAVKTLGYSTPEAALGRRFKQWGREGKIIGVMKDFHYHSLQQKIQPLSMRIEPGAWELMSVNVRTTGLPATIAAIEKAWNTFAPGMPFNYQFLDDNFNRQYNSDERFGRLFFYFSILAIFISCLGLLGLVAYSTLQRSKEIGIRKVLGASAVSVMLLLSKDFVRLIAIAAVIAIPLVWYGMHQWLNGYAYRTNITWWIFAAAGLITLFIAVFTVSFHALKAALANPVKSLQAE